jgi:hypothetical protein
MKKALIVLLILGLAGGLFAQSWSGSVSTGARIDFGDDVTIKATADGDDNKSVKTSVSYKGSGDDWGFTVGAINSNVVYADNSSTFTIGDYNGWVSFADMFKLTVGKGIGDAWATGGNTDAKINNGGNSVGYRLNITPAAVSGLDFGFRFGYPANKAAGTTIGNFFQETGVGAKYSADVWNVAAGIDFLSEEAGGFDGDAYVGFNYTGLGDYLSLIHAGLKAGKALTDPAVTIFQRLSGGFVGVGWQLDLKEVLDPLAVNIDLGLDYGIPISDKTSATIGADAGASYADEFKLGEWDVWAELNYKFNGSVSTKAYFELGNDFDFSLKFAPFLRWTIGYSF